MQSFERGSTTIDCQQKLELFISCRSLLDKDKYSKSDPYVIVYAKQNNQWFEIDRTEIIKDNLNPNFAKSIIIDYFFEVSQPLKFACFDYDGPDKSEVLGTCETTLAAIAGAKDQILVKELLEIKTKKSKPKIIVRADQVQLTNDRIEMTFKGSGIKNTKSWCFCQTTSPFLMFYRIRKDDQIPILVYKTEEVQSNRNPEWKQIDIKSQKLCNGDYNMPIKVEIWDFYHSGNHEYIGETTFTVNELQNNKVNSLKFIDKKNNQDVGKLVIQKFNLIEKSTFLDYIQGGTQMNLIIAIDFTASNKNPADPSSLHYLNPFGQLNQYEAAISSVSEILLNYDYDQNVPVFGFGCKPRLAAINSQETLHCFPLNGNINNPEVVGIQGIMDVYHYAIQNVILDGPTYFNPIIQESIKISQVCRDMNADIYFTLLILTDGQIHDMKETIRSIIDASHVPLSIIIIGVGEDDFINMQVLDNDDGAMKDNQGRKAKRDLVQFVPFNKFCFNPQLLAKEVLYELPDQLVDYMTLIGRKPGQKQFIQLENFLMDPMGSSNAPSSGFSKFKQNTNQQDYPK